MKLGGEYKKAASRSAVWIVYAIIFFEMLYMATPFAIFFYSVYAMPLKALNHSDTSAWLVQSILPHFTQSSSIVINVLLWVSWPLMGIGFIIFGIGFGQVYWSKFRRKGAVFGGIYRYSRHPQYAAWIIFGLGMAIFWSRMIVIITYVSMLFVYYFLAKAEERECLRKYGESYQAYLEKTGRFLPRFSPRKLHNPRKILPQRGLKRVAAIMVIYLVTIFCTIELGLWLRSYSLSEISTVSWKDSAAISTSLMGQPQMTEILSIARNDQNARRTLRTLVDSPGTKQLIYIVPLEWNISELAMEADRDGEHEHGFNPTTHMNPTQFNPNLYKVLFSKAVVDDGAEGDEIISKARAQKPLLLVKVDLLAKRVIDIEKPPQQGKYANIPVPLF
jgi:protein-S-isoprenylcysteine O-methyltransferase Ste14